MGSTTELNSSTEVLGYCSYKLHPQIASPRLRNNPNFVFIEFIFMFAYFIPKMTEPENQNALFITMQLQLDSLQTNKDLTYEGHSEQTNHKM